MKRHSVGWVAEGIKTVWEGEDGLWQLGASTSRWIFVNARFKVRTGCYQTFIAESIQLSLQQGEQRSCYQNLSSCSVGFRQSPLTECWITSCLAGLSPLWSSGEFQVSPHLPIFPILSAFLRWGSGRSWRSLCPFNAVSKNRVISRGAASLWRELTYMCTSLATCAWQKACSVSFKARFLYASRFFSSFSPSFRSQVLSVSTFSW